MMLNLSNEKNKVYAVQKFLLSQWICWFVYDCHVSSNLAHEMTAEGSRMIDGVNVLVKMDLSTVRKMLSTLLRGKEAREVGVVSTP